MIIQQLLIANRGEIAIRIARTATELGIRTHAIFSRDDAHSDHVHKADEAHALSGVGPSAYLNAEQIIHVARTAGCDAIHPGYGFLSENAAFAQHCAAAGMRFIGPTAEVLERFGDKARARALAAQLGVPILHGTDGPTTLEQAQSFLRSLGSGGVMVKAIAGGGGRGMRPAHSAQELEAAFARCRSEAAQAFGNGDVYLEKLFTPARHIEVQVAGDGSGAVVHFGERECSIQRNRQKLLEIAPAPWLSHVLRERLIDAAVRMARAARLGSLATFEFLVEPSAQADAEFAFIEANPRLQVEHTVTEMVTGADLVRIQLELAAGRRLEELGLRLLALPRGIALQLRVNAENMAPDGSVRAASGTLHAFDLPAGPGVRVDTYGHVGFRSNLRFDSLLAKVIVHAASGELTAVAAKARRALAEFRIAGIATNREFLLNLLELPEFLEGRWHTGLLEANLAALCANTSRRPLFAEYGTRSHSQSAADASDPLAVLAYGKRESATASLATPLPDGSTAVSAPLAGSLLSIDVAAGERVEIGQQIAVIESMKMEHVVAARVAGVVRAICASAGETVAEGASLVFIDADQKQSAAASAPSILNLDQIRPDLAELDQRRAQTLDAARPEAVTKRHALGLRTARENIADLCDPGSFHEYGAFAVAAQRSRRTMEDLIARTPADGLVMGVGRVNGALFPDADARCVVMSYDYTVLAGTQGHRNHEKKDRMFELAAQWQLPLIVFAEGGGGRPGDTDVVTSGMAPHQGVHFAGPAERFGTDGGDRLRPLLRRQRRGRWLLRRHLSPPRILRWEWAALP